jgi:hypothetical protein
MLMDMIKSPFKNNYYAESDRYAEPEDDYDLPLQNSDKTIMRNEPAALRNSKTSEMFAEAQASSRPSMIVEEKHASQVNISEYMMLNSQKYGRTRK